MKICKCCKQEGKKYEKSKVGEKWYELLVCTECKNKQRAAGNKKRLAEIRKMPIKKDYCFCRINDGKLYDTMNLSEQDVIELKEKGYGFIFKVND